MRNPSSVSGEDMGGGQIKTGSASCGERMPSATAC
jgi:hypothetical protein